VFGSCLEEFSQVTVKKLCGGSRLARRSPCIKLRCLGHLLPQEAGIPAKFAPTIGIAVDHRRKNRSLETMQVVTKEEHVILQSVTCQKQGSTAGSAAVPWSAQTD
jgi:hypothetical protein